MTDLEQLKAMLTRAKINFIEARTDRWYGGTKEAPVATALVSIHTDEAEFWTTFIFHQDGSLKTMKAEIELTDA